MRMLPANPRRRPHFQPVEDRELEAGCPIRSDFVTLSYAKDPVNDLYNRQLHKLRSAQAPPMRHAAGGHSA
jgi:hypothetical protein